MANSSEKKSLIFKVAISVPINRLFDYLAPEKINSNTTVLPGTRVIVPFGKHQKVGFVISVCDTSEFNFDRIKHILEILDETPLITDKDIQLLQWASKYYHYPLGEIISFAFPATLRKGQKATLAQEKYYQLSAKGELINSEQLNRSPKQKRLFELIQSENKALSAGTLKQWDKNWHSTAKSLLEKDLLTIELRTKTAGLNPRTTEPALVANQQQLEAINKLTSNLNQFSVTLLEGITGSGKTEVYMQVIQKVLDLGLQIIVLLPEITLTPQLEDRFKRRFSVLISLSHSKLNESQRHNAWLEMQQGHSSILLGTRSALFTPFNRPGLIILDEEHDSSFKQQDGFRFSARDLAIVRAKSLNIPIILGTATPSLETLLNAEKGRYQRLQLTQRTGQAIEPKFWLLDIRNKKLLDGLSEPLIEEIKKTLLKKEQVLLFLNRRGFAPVQICHACAWVARCRDCDTSLVIHYQQSHLRCHHCGYQQPLLKLCPDCITGELKPLGIGTERVESQLHSLFPEQKIVRLDRDTTQRKGSLEHHLQQINQGKTDIILGTQMLAKGHHFPNVTLVAIIDVDSGLFSIDFHSTEKLAQLIIQVAGRAGRAEKPGKVLLQTRQPDHPLLNILLKMGYNQFAKTALAERQQACLPPFSFQALFRAYANDPEKPQLFLKTICQIIDSINSPETLVLGPVSAPMAKRAGNFHFQLLLQNSQRTQLQLLLDKLTPQIYTIKEAKKVRWSLDIDPIDLY